jgi:Mg/Co/Ni transporter MgtE
VRLATLLGPELKKLIDESPDQIRELLEDLHPEDVAGALADLAPDEVAKVVALLISTGGNSGSQSATLAIRGLAVGELRPRDWWRVLYREAGVGLTLGVGLGAIGLLRVLMYRD